MRFLCTQENLTNAIDTVSAITNKQTNLPILVNVLIQATESKVELITTNLELAIKFSLRAKVEKTGSFTVPAKTLADYVHLLSDEQVEIDLEENELKIKCGNSNTKIKGSPAEDFPVLPDVEENFAYSLLVEPFKETLSKVVIAAAKNEIRPELSGIYFGFFTERFKGLVLAATDSYRLSEKKMSVSQGDATKVCIVPARTVSEIIRLLGLSRSESSESSVRLLLSETQLSLRYDNFELTSRLIDGTYPDYVQIIPKEFKTNVVFPVDVMVKKIKAASLFTTTGVNAVSFDFNVAEKNIGISSVSTQKGEHSSTIDVEVSGEENSILLNHRYVLDGLQNIEGEADFGMNSADMPCMLKQKGKDDFLYIIMPIRQ